MFLFLPLTETFSASRHPEEGKLCIHRSWRVEKTSRKLLAVPDASATAMIRWRTIRFYGFLLQINCTNKDMHDCAQPAASRKFIVDCKQSKACLRLRTGRERVRWDARNSPCNLLIYRQHSIAGGWIESTGLFSWTRTIIVFDVRWTLARENDQSLKAALGFPSSQEANRRVDEPTRQGPILRKHGNAVREEFWCAGWGLGRYRGDKFKKK